MGPTSIHSSTQFATSVISKLSEVELSWYCLGYLSNRSQQFILRTKNVCIVEYRQVPFDCFGSVEEVVTPFPGYKNLMDVHKWLRDIVLQNLHLYRYPILPVMFTTGLSSLNIF